MLSVHPEQPPWNAAGRMQWTVDYNADNMSPNNGTIEQYIQQALMNWVEDIGMDYHHIALTGTIPDCHKRDFRLVRQGRPYGPRHADPKAALRWVFQQETAITQNSITATITGCFNFLHAGQGN